MIESETGVVTPDDDQNFRPTTDLAAMATSLDVIHDKRANHWVGTSAQRISATADLAEGSFWSDTTGLKVVWVKSGSAWSQVWPAPTVDVLRVGGYDRTGNVFLNLRRDDGGGRTSAASLQVSENQVMLSKWRDGVSTSTLRLYDTGRLFVSTSAGSSTPPAFRPFPLANARGRVSVDVPSGGGIVAVPISFPSEIFPSDPNVQVTLESEFPSIGGVSVNRITKDGCTIFVYRSSGARVAVHWEATLT